MKQIFIHTVVAASFCLFASCTQDDALESASDVRRPLVFSVVDAGYHSASAGASATRIIEEDFTTKFQENDSCGLFVVKNGLVEMANIKLKAIATEDGETGTITWVPQVEQELWYTKGTSYYLYYPWQESWEGMPEVGTNRLVADDAGFFEELIASWMPAAEQSTYKTYTANDLMTATAQINESDTHARISFTMKHQMGLAVLLLPEPTTPPTEETPEEKAAASEIGGPVFDDASVKPCLLAPGVYRYLFNPTDYDFKFSGSYQRTGVQRLFEIEVNPTEINSIGNGVFQAGSYIKYVVDDATEE